MIIFDFYFYTIFCFLSKKLSRSKEDAKHSALCILALYIPFTIDIIAYIIGIFNDNKISRFFIEKDFFSAVGIGIISYSIFRIRYYQKYDVDDIGHFINDLSYNKKVAYKYATYSTLILVPVFLFVFYRMYKFGYV